MNNLELKNKTVLVTGGNGFLGKKIVENLEALGINDIIIPSSDDFDLRNIENCKKVVSDADIVFHLAANTGGIGLNKEKPGEIFYDNLIMGTHLLHESKMANVEKFIALGTICSYPKFSQIPFLEEDICNGYPVETNAPYGLAKKMLLVQSQAYRQQYNFKSIVIIPTNLFGPNDNYSPVSSQVIPSLILKIKKAKNSNADSIIAWGDGTATRDFLFVDDAAEGLILASEKYDDETPLNLGSSEEISIKQVVEHLCQIMNFNGKIIWDKTKPNGQPRRCVSNYRARELLKFKPEVSIKEGLTQTIEWFSHQQDKV